MQASCPHCTARRWRTYAGPIAGHECLTCGVIQRGLANGHATP